MNTLTPPAPPAVLTRFAPAPTGVLHLGHVANALYVWGLAARLGAAVLLRIEDHDRQRSRPEYERAILDDLDWLGFRPDRPTTDAFRSGPCASRQSDRHTAHADAARALAARGLIYGCTCSRRDRAAAGPETPQRYPGTCRTRGLTPGPGVTWRLNLGLAAGVDAPESFDDVLCGRRTQHPVRDAGDVAIRDRHGNWTYPFAVVVDDWQQGVDLVVRGLDLLHATGLQILLGRLLGRPVPARFAHHPLVMRTPAQKLSKSDGDTGVAALRAAGLDAAAVIGRAAHAVGLTDRDTPVEAAAVGRLFTRVRF